MEDQIVYRFETKDPEDPPLMVHDAENFEDAIKKANASLANVSSMLAPCTPDDDWYVAGIALKKTSENSMTPIDVRCFQLVNIEAIQQ
ncbi:hypothetical protein [Agrobacterium pusense]|uniref:hypothetical protein n=1 Tax=Agrobacterium pusense TaxID=648995 RepID=UPI000D1AF733|nr:hypothetical protein [Agrobacterium pusense]